MDPDSLVVAGFNGSIEVESLLPHLLRMEAPDSASPRTPSARPSRSPPPLFVSSTPSTPLAAKPTPSPSPPPSSHPSHHNNNNKHNGPHDFLGDPHRNGAAVARFYRPRSRSPSPPRHRRSPSPTALDYPPAKKLKKLDADFDNFHHSRSKIPTMFSNVT